MIAALRNWLFPRFEPLPEPVDRTVRYRVEEAGGFFFVFIYRKYTDLWAEDFVGPEWSWYRIKNARFKTREEADACGVAAVETARGELAEEAADQIGRANYKDW